MCSLYICPPISVTAVFDAKRTLKVRALKVRWKSKHHCFTRKHWLNIVCLNVFVSFESSWKDQWIHGEAKLKTHSDFLKPIGGFTVSRVLRSQMIFAACFILCAAGSLFTSNSADSANVFAESNITISNGVLPIISIIQYPYTNGGKPDHTISEFSLNAKEGD